MYALLLDPSLCPACVLARTGYPPQPALVSLASGQVVSRALHEAGVKVRFNTSVTAIRRLANGSFSLALREEGARQLCQVQSRQAGVRMISARVHAIPLLSGHHCRCILQARSTVAQ